jgi:hypothetical protein
MQVLEAPHEFSAVGGQHDAAPRYEDAAYLPQRLLLLGHMVQHVIGHDAFDAAVGQGKQPSIGLRVETRAGTVSLSNHPERCIDADDPQTSQQIVDGSRAATDVQQAEAGFNRRWLE